MRTSRLLARRIALFETLLSSAQTDADRRRIAAAIRNVRVEARQRVHSAIRYAGEGLAGPSLPAGPDRGKRGAA